MYWKESGIHFRQVQDCRNAIYLLLQAPINFVLKGSLHQYHQLEKE